MDEKNLKFHNIAVLIGFYGFYRKLLDFKMVPDLGDKSNQKSLVLAAWNSNKKDISEVENTLTPEVVDELFETLKYWNIILENDTPYFQEPRL